MWARRKNKEIERERKCCIAGKKGKYIFSMGQCGQKNVRNREVRRVKRGTTEGNKE